MESIFSESAIETIKKIKKGFLWTAVCILIGEVVVGAVLIVVQSFSVTIGKLMGTFALCGLMLFLGVNNFSLMEKKDRIAQCFALISLIGNTVWLILSILFIWEVLPFTERIEGGAFLGYSYHMTVMAKAFVVAIDIATMGFVISNVWAIKETLKPVKPLKITALICALYCGIYAVVVTLGEVQAVMDGRWYGLAALAGFAFIVMACAAAIVSDSGAKKEKEANNGLNGVNNEVVQAKIQEMVEKEVQARMAAIQGGNVVQQQDANNTQPVNKQ
ncbi:hypothetical protein IKF30_00760 [Candidatus Saccharibacteria bacterium]|nr:hypothetical protein [Candidatus Saccharibacteria bacterium]